MPDAVAGSARLGECSPFLDFLGDPCLASDAHDKVREVVMSKNPPAAQRHFYLMSLEAVQDAYCGAVLNDLMPFERTVGKVRDSVKSDGIKQTQVNAGVTMTLFRKPNASSSDS